MSLTTIVEEQMIAFDWFARWLIACQKPPDANGYIIVHLADAICLRRMGFWNVEPGRWKIPPLPPEILDRYPALVEITVNELLTPLAPVRLASQSVSIRQRLA